jgi:hypothetical protein
MADTDIQTVRRSIYIKISDLQVEVVTEQISLHRRTLCKIASLVGLVRGTRGRMTAGDP